MSSTQLQQATSHPSAKQTANKRKRKCQSEDDVVLEQLAKNQETIQMVLQQRSQTQQPTTNEKNAYEKSEHFHFAMQLVPMFDSLPTHQVWSLKARIMSLVAEFMQPSQPVQTFTSSLGETASFIHNMDC